MIPLLCRLIARTFLRIRIHGEPPRTLPERAILIANHQSLLDGILVQAFVPTTIGWVVHAQIAERWYFRLILRFVPHLLVDAARPMAMKKVVEWIDGGRLVMIFPEGRVTVTGGLMKVYEGPAFLAAKTGATVYPVFIDGAVNSIFSRLAAPFPIRWRPRVSVTFFPPRRLPMPEARTGRQRRRLATERVRVLLQQMSFEAHPRPALFEAFLNAVELHGRSKLILEDIQPQQYTYGKLLRGALALGRLVSRATGDGENVGVLMPNVGATVMLLFGMLGARRVPAMINYTAGVEGMQSACELAGIRVIVTSRAFLEKARLTEKAGQLTGVRLLCLEDLRPQFRLPDKLWLMLYALRRPRKAFPPSRPGDPAFILFTSGSEGKPKGVVLSHAAVMANVAQLRSAIEFGCRDKFLAALPLFHSFGLTGGLMLPLLSGASTFLYPSPLHYRMIPEIAYDRDCTVLSGTGTFLGQYARLANSYDFRSLRYVIAGAEKLSEEVRRLWMDKFGIRLLEGYGATECAPAIAIAAPMAWRHGAVGRILPGMDHFVEAVPGMERGGLLHVRGPNVMLGYLRHDAPGVIQPPSSSHGMGWYNTGDIVEMDEDGFLHILGRVRRFAKVAGEMVSLEVVENIALAASPARAHAATTVSHSTRGETIILFTEDPALRREHLMRSARHLGLPEVAVARRLEPVPKLPRLATGKFDYVTLKALAEERQEVPATVEG